MPRSALPPKPEETARWRKRVEEVRNEMFNKPCKKQFASSFMKHTRKEMGEEEIRGLLEDSFDLVTQRSAEDKSQ